MEISSNENDMPTEHDVKWISKQLIPHEFHGEFFADEPLGLDWGQALKTTTKKHRGDKKYEEGWKRHFWPALRRKKPGIPKMNIPSLGQMENIQNDVIPRDFHEVFFANEPLGLTWIQAREHTLKKHPSEKIYEEAWDKYFWPAWRGRFEVPSSPKDVSLCISPLAWLVEADSCRTMRIRKLTKRKIPM